MVSENGTCNLMKKNKRILTTAKPFTPVWWFEIYSYAVVQDALAIERHQWKRTERFHQIKTFVYQRFNIAIHRAMELQKENCANIYARSTYDSNEFLYKGKPLRNSVKKRILNAENIPVR